MRILLCLFVLVVVHGCAQEDTVSAVEKYQIDHPDRPGDSKSNGSVSNGSLVNGKLMPFSGENFSYFDTTSYLNSRAYVNDKVKNAVLNAYKKCDSTCPGYRFVLMECSNKDGGKIWPHRTHQNGLSVDFAMPLKKGDQQCKDYDLIGADHYFLDFDQQGILTTNKDVSIDFEIVCRHILALNEASKAEGLRIKKVIIKTDLKDDLFASPSGEKLRNTGIYVVKKLEPLINRLHDDHYHIDFEIVD